MSKVIKSKSKKHGPTKPVYAATDGGSNNVRVDFYGVNANGNVVKINVAEQTIFPVKLAEDMTIRKPVIKRDNLVVAVHAFSAIDALLTKYKIEPENTVSFMTEAVRRVQHTKVGKEDIKTLASAYGNRKFIILTGKEEAVLGGRAALLACPYGWLNHRGKRISIVFAAAGGGSVQLGVITARGKIKSATSLAVGVHMLWKQSNHDMAAAGKIYEKTLQKKYPGHVHKHLVVIGRIWRAVGEEGKKYRLPRALHGKKKIDQTLIAAARRKPAYYRARGGKWEANADFMALGASMLRRTAKHFEATKVIVLDVTTRDAAIDELHRLRTGQITKPTSELKRLFCP